MQFEDLPVEVQVDYFKANPQFRQVSRKYYEKGADVFKYEHCFRPISKQEITRYINNKISNKADLSFKMYEYDGKEYIFKNIYIAADKLVGLSTNMKILPGYEITTSKSSLDFVVLADIINNIEYYDLKTTFNIISQRFDCIDLIPNYIQKYLIQHVTNVLSSFDQMKPKQDIDILFVKLMKFAYIKTNIEELWTFGFDYKFEQINQKLIDNVEKVTNQRLPKLIEYINKL